MFPVVIVVAVTLPINGPLKYGIIPDPEFTRLMFAQEVTGKVPPMPVVPVPVIKYEPFKLALPLKYVNVVAGITMLPALIYNAVPIPLNDELILPDRFTSTEYNLPVLTLPVRVEPMLP